jgi:hypothetical protein
METPEEFAAMLDRCAHAAEGMGERLTDTYRVADLIRARDAEIRADERARVSVVHSTLTDQALVDELVRRGVLPDYYSALGADDLAALLNPTEGETDGPTRRSASD